MPEVRFNGFACLRSQVRRFLPPGAVSRHVRALLTQHAYPGAMGPCALARACICSRLLWGNRPWVMVYSSAPAPRLPQREGKGVWVPRMGCGSTAHVGSLSVQFISSHLRSVCVPRCELPPVHALEARSRYGAEPIRTGAAHGLFYGLVSTLWCLCPDSLCCGMAVTIV